MVIVLMVASAIAKMPVYAFPGRNAKEETFICGDDNGDMHVDISDPYCIARYVYVPGAPPLLCFETFDASDDGDIDMSYITDLLHFLSTRVILLHLISVRIVELYQLQAGSTAIQISVLQVMALKYFRYCKRRLRKCLLDNSINYQPCWWPFYSC